MPQTLTEQIASTEAILFASGEPVEIETLCNALEITPLEFEPVLQGLALLYLPERGVRLMRYENALQLCTRPQYMDLIEKVLQPVRRQSLTQAALETLAVVAYKQPITRLEIEQIRGVQCDRALATLVHHDLIAEVGRKESVGRPILYGTTERFLQHFALESMNELPRITELPDTDELTDFGSI